MKGGSRMLRMSWRPGRALLRLEGVVDVDHRDLLGIASAAAVGTSDVLLVDIERAHIDGWGRAALYAMEGDLWRLCKASAKTSAALDISDLELSA